MKAKTEMISCMNNTKWREFFDAIDESMDISYNFDTPVLVKYIDCNQPVKEELNPHGVNGEKGIIEYWTHPKDPRQYTGERFPSLINYKDIEWLFFPTVFEEDIYRKRTRNNPSLKVGTRIIETDILPIKELIDKLGKLDYEINDDGLKLYGYR